MPKEALRDFNMSHMRAERDPNDGVLYYRYVIHWFMQQGDDIKSGFQAGFCSMHHFIGKECNWVVRGRNLFPRETEKQLPFTPLVSEREDR